MEHCLGVGSSLVMGLSVAIFGSPSSSRMFFDRRGNDQEKPGWPIQTFFWLEWGCCGPLSKVEMRSCFAASITGM